MMGSGSSVTGTPHMVYVRALPKADPETSDPEAGAWVRGADLAGVHQYHDG